MRTTVGVLVVGVAGLAGCAGNGPDPVEVVDAGAFREPERPSTGMPPDTTPGESEDSGRVSLVSEPPAEVAVITPEEASGEAARDAAPAPDAPRVLARPGDTVVIDAKVGDINGRAVYADEFLREMEARFVQEASQKSPEVWLSDLRKAIEDKILALLREELLRAEALAAMPDEQRTAGLNAFLGRMRQRLESRNRGSSALAAGRIREELGASSDEFLRGMLNKELTRMILETQVKDRVNISWREIVQEYQRSFEMFNPEPEAAFRWIRVPAEDTASIAEIARQLGEGEAFADVATIETNRFRPEEGGLMDTQTIEGSMDGLRLFSNGTLNEAAVSLRPGEFAGPIEAEFSGRRFANWVYLEGIRRISVPLYDAQLAIAQMREDEEIDLELKRFYGRLTKRTSVTDLEQMHDRLTRIAVERYNPRALALLPDPGERQ